MTFKPIGEAAARVVANAKAEKEREIEMNSVAVKKGDVPLVPDQFAAMIERLATNPSVNVETIERLLAVQERVIERSAKSAYAAALADMQTELPVIAERGKIDIGRGKPQSYALWEDINDAIKPILSRHGFSLSFRTGQADGKISVTGVLAHRCGHSEETTIHLPSDTSGSKNAVQAVGSSTSYGKRYTAAALLNLTSRGEDDDGNSASGYERITQEQADAIRDLLEVHEKKLPAFLQWARVERVEDLPADRYESVVNAIKAPKKQPA